MPGQRLKSQFEASKRWSVGETLQLLNYLKANRDFEKPSASCYYANLLAATDIKVDPARWDLLQTKVNELISDYQITENWLHLKKTKNDEEAKNLCHAKLNVQIKNMCPFFEQIREIFGNHNRTQLKMSEAEAFDDMCLEMCIASELSDDEMPISFPKHKIKEKLIHEVNSVFCTPQNTNTGTDKDYLKDRKIKKEPVTSLHTIKREHSNTSSKIKDERIKEEGSTVSNNQKKLFRLEWKRLQFERYKFDKWYQLKKLNIERKYELRKLELEEDRKTQRFDEVMYLSRHSKKE